jgi:hypothetical protein
MLIIGKIEDIEQIDADWDRSDYSSCNPCWIGVNDLGLYQCRDCLCLFLGRLAITGKKGVIECLKEQYLDLWEEEYKKLKETRSFVRRGKLDQLQQIYCTYRRENGTIKTDRYFYEKKQ